MVNEWGKDAIGESGYSSVGAVVGATYPEMGKVLRKIMPKSFILVPGYGAQGGKAADLVIQRNHCSIQAGEIFFIWRSKLCRCFPSGCC